MVAIAFNATQCLRIPGLHHSITIHKVFSIMRPFFVYFPISASYYNSFLLSGSANHHVRSGVPGEQCFILFDSNSSSLGLQILRSVFSGALKLCKSDAR